MYLYTNFHISHSNHTQPSINLLTQLPADSSANPYKRRKTAKLSNLRYNSTENAGRNSSVNQNIKLI